MNTPDEYNWEHLRQYGYAPGGYFITCVTCKRDRAGCDKRAARCRDCAEHIHQLANAAI